MVRSFFAIAIAIAIAIDPNSCDPAQAIRTTVCKVVPNPISYNGKIVSIRGTVTLDLESFEIEDPNCKGKGIVLSYPHDLGMKPKPSFQLRRDVEFDRFSELVRARAQNLVVESLRVPLCVLEPTTRGHRSDNRLKNL